jgi:type VI secretion system ImpC/EvpB family protein
MAAQSADRKMLAEHSRPTESLAEARTAVPRTAEGLTPDWLQAAVERREPALAERLSRFHGATTVGEALEAWCGRRPDDRESLVRRLVRDIARIDQLLNAQLNAILHHPQFQRLEASWRGVEYLTECQAAEGDVHLQIRVLSVTRKELERDFERSLEFDQSELFRKVYEDEFGTPGGEPLGCLIADYEIHPTVTAEHPHNDIALLRSLAQVGAAAFCPIIANASPAMFGADDFQALEHTIDHTRTFSQATYLPWNSLRQAEDARFIGLAMPRILMRRPYADDGRRVDRFCFHEDVSGLDRRKYLWGGAAYAMGEVLIRSFAQAGWLADIRGVKRDEERGGLVTRLPAADFSTDAPGIATRFSTDIVITDEAEKQLSDLGFIPLCHCKDTDYLAFYSNPSIQKPKRYDRAIATTNASISAMLQYIFCVSRFAHYIKVLGRDKTGAFSTSQDLENMLHNWIIRYVTADAEASTDVKARHPLRAAQIKVYPVPGRPGAFNCTMHLAPHYELDELNATVTLQAELTPARTAV